MSQKWLKIRWDAVLREDINSRDINSADGWRVACSGLRFRHGSPALTSFYARATRARKKSRALAVERYRDCAWREATTVTDEETNVVDEI